MKQTNIYTRNYQNQKVFVHQRSVSDKFFSYTFLTKRMKHLLFILPFLTGLLSPNFASAQNTCNNPTPICPNQNFQFAPGGPAGLPPGLNVSNPVFAGPSGTNQGCQFNDAINPQWLLLTVVSSGSLSFNLGGPGSTAPQNGMLHWSLYQYNANTCANIVGNTQAPIACNYNCSFAGGTGFGSLPPAPANQCNYFQTGGTPFMVNPGDQFLLLVSNVNGTNTSISFNNTGTAQLGCSPFTVNSVTLCPNQPSVVASSWPGYTGITYTILPPPPAGSVQPGPNFSVAAAATTVYTVTAVAANNGFGQPTQATAFFTVTINPTATISVATATDYCYGSTAIFTVSPQAASVSVYGPILGPVVNLTSVPGTTVAIPNLTSPNYTGTYSITATLTTGCVGTTTTDIFVSPNYFITAATPLSQCQNGNVSLTASMPTATSYVWYAPPCLPSFTTASGNTAINNVQPICAGVFTVTTDGIFNSARCPRSATVQVNVVPTYSIDTAPSLTVCQGGTISLAATASNSPQFAWSGPMAFNQQGANVLVTNSAVPGHQGPYQVTASYNAFNLSCPRTATTNVYVVAVYPVSVLVPTTICQYQNAPVALVAAGAPIAYSWSGPNNYTATASSTVVPNIQLNGTGTYSGTATWAQGTVECSVTNYANITVVPVNSITITPPDPVCQPGNVYLLANSVGATSYSWNGPGGFSASTPNPVLYYPPLSASGVYTVSTTYNTGGVICGNVTTVAVSVNPVLNYTLEPFRRACVGESVTITGPAGATSYTWTSSSGLAIDLPNNKDLMFSDIKEPHSGVYTLKASLGPCITSKQVEVRVISAISFTNPPSGYKECVGVSLPMSVGVQGGSENYNIEWFPNSYFDGAPTGSVVNVTPLGTTVYNIKAYDLACPSKTISHSFVFEVMTAPRPNLDLDKYEGCAPLCIELRPGLKRGEATVTYDFGGPRKLQPVDSITSYCGLNEPGLYTMKVTSIGENGCPQTFSLNVPITVFPDASSELLWTPDEVTTNEGLVTFNTYSKNNGKVESYEWLFGGNGISVLSPTNIANPQVQYPEVGKYPVLLITTTDEGCRDTVFRILEVKDELNVYIPNTFTPNDDGVNDFFMVKGLGFKTEGFTMEVFDRWGHLVYMSRDYTKGWDGTVKGGRPVEGVYIYRIRAVGANGEGRQEFTGHVTLIR